MPIWRGCGTLVVVLLGLACAGTSIAAERPYILQAAAAVTVFAR